MPIGTQWRANERLGGRATSLRQILAELDHDHDRRADCYHHRADKRQLFQQADKDRPDPDSSLHMRKAPTYRTHRISPLAPSSSGLIFNAKRAPAIAYSGVP